MAGLNQAISISIDQQSHIAIEIEPSEMDVPDAAHVIDVSRSSITSANRESNISTSAPSSAT